MTEILTIRLLGGLTIALGERPLTNLGTRKAEALLAYLVMHKRPFSRDLLADLLWDDRPQEQALANLRSLLSGLRRTLKPYLTITRQTVAFNHDSAYWLDVAEFEKLLKIEESSLAEANHQSLIANLQSAITLYQDNFLAGFHIREAHRFEEWATLERERLQRLAVTALHQLVADALQNNQLNSGTAYAARLIKHDPYSEAARQQMMRLLVRSGQRNAALAHYEQFRQFLADEIGVPPLPETNALYERIKFADPGRHNLSPQPTPFVGRQAELAAIAAHLANPDCRLLTITGPGGMGKTRLAVQAAENQIGRYLNGIILVPLTAVTTASTGDTTGLVIEAIAEKLGLSFQGTDSIEAELVDYLRQKEMLLVLDNFEHLVAAAPLLHTILKQAPDVKLLVTSRERLNLQGEWLFDLHGLLRPAADQSDAVQSEAVQLFLQSARRVAAGFAADTAVTPAIVRICHLVRGMPLAIELAASWVRLLTPQEIVAEIENNLSFLTSTLRDLPERHQSMQAVFDASWELLTPAEQAIMAQLSVLRGRFSRDAAQAVAGISLPGLLALVDKSLVRKRTETGTAVAFQLHEILRQYAAQKLSQQPALEQEARDRHGRYYAQFLQNHEKSLLQSGQKQALAAISAEIDNIRAAWQWFIQQENQTLLEQALVGMYLFYWARSWLREGFTAFQNAAAIIQHNDALLARILWRQAEFAAWLSQFDEAQSLLTCSITILRATGSQSELAMALEANGRLLYWQGHYTRARQQVEESLAIFRQIDDAPGQAQALNSLANIICEEQADYTRAETLFLESLGIVQQLGDGFGIAKVLINQGATAQATGDLERARQLMQESLTLYQDVEYQYGISAALSYLGQVTAQLGDYAAAADLIRQSLDIHRQSGNRRAIVDALEQLALVVYKMGDVVAAKHYYAEAIRLAQALQSPRLIQTLLTAVAQLAFTENQVAQAHKIITFVLAQPSLSPKLKEDAEQLLAEINDAQPSVAIEREQTTAKALIQEILNKLLL